MGRLAELHPKRFFLETWQQMDEEAAAARAQRAAEGKGYDYAPLVSLLFGCFFLILMEYVGMPRFMRDVLTDLDAGGPDGFLHELRGSPYWDFEDRGSLLQHAYWAGWRVLGFFLLPVAVIKLSGGRVRDNGLAVDGFLDHLWIYGLAFVVVLAMVIGVSYTDEFSTYYPFYRRASRSWADLLMWEAFYFAQFFSLEFFFRGWWLTQCKRVMGSHAIYVMIVPYVMIHFGKPMPETIGAIFAGLALGTLSMKTRSIWSGMLIHCSVAVSMDVAALIQTSGLPESFYPG